MRLLVVLPELISSVERTALVRLAQRRPRLAQLPAIRRRVIHPALYTDVAWGGSLNNMRQAAIARSLGLDSRLVCPSGRDTYGRFSVVDLPWLRWDARRDDDIVLLPDFCSDLADQVRGPAIVYLQSPLQLRRDFDYRRHELRLWANSPYMRRLAEQAYPGKPVEIAPIIVDDRMFPFLPQPDREPGLLFAFPRKGPDFIEATQAHYARLGGTYWRFERIDGLPLSELAQRMRRPQAFLASAEIEGCALPPQESMAAGIVVVGRSARRANFQMRHRETAMVAETPEEAAACLRELENAELRVAITRTAFESIRRFFPANEPTAHWRATLSSLGMAPADRPNG